MKLVSSDITRTSDSLSAFAAGGGTQVKGIAWSITGKTLAGEVYPGVAPYGFTSTTGRSIARARVAFTSSAVFTVKKNNITVATVTFAAAATTGTWSANITWADGDLASLDPPTTPDATGADIIIAARE